MRDYSYSCYYYRYCQFIIITDAKKTPLGFFETEVCGLRIPNLQNGLFIYGFDFPTQFSKPNTLLDQK
jgi:hypothetical protein